MTQQEKIRTLQEVIDKHIKGAVVESVYYDGFRLALRTWIEFRLSDLMALSSGLRLPPESITVSSNAFFNEDRYPDSEVEICIDITSERMNELLASNK